MVHGQDHVLLQSACRLGIRPLAGQHLEVGGGVAQVGIGIDRRQPLVHAVEPHEQDGGERDHPQRVGADLVGGEVERRLEIQGRCAQRDRGAECPRAV